jgi:hypothetical protein
MTRNNGNTTELGRKTDGKFAKGNPGRPRGARHKTTLAIQALLDGEGEALTRKAVEMALEGDGTALRLCLERIVPPRKDAPVRFDIPRMKSARDAVKAAGAVIDAVASGDLTPTEGAHVMALVDGFRRTLETSDLEARVLALEEGV